MKVAIRAMLMLAIVAVPIVIWAQTTPTAPVPPAVPPNPATQPAPQVAPAPPPPSDGPMPMDLDGDGVVTAAEHATGARALFDHMDADHDGRVTREEMITFQRQVLGMPGR